MPKHKGLNPTPNNSKSPIGQRDSIGFSHHIPQQAPSVCFHLIFLILISNIQS